MKIQSASEIPFSGSFSVEDFNKSIASFDMVSSLMSLQKLGAHMGNQVWININLEFEFYATPKKKLKAGTITRDFISFAAKEVLLNCGESEVHYNDIGLADLVYKYGNIKTDIDQLTPATIKEQGWLWTIRSTNHQWSYLRPYFTIVGRYHWIFSRIFEKNSSLGQSLNSALGMDVSDAMKIGTCIFANYCPREDGTFADSFLLSSYTNTSITELKTLLTEANIMKFLEVFSATPEGFREEAKKYELTDPALKKYEYNPLKRYPIIKTGSTQEVRKFIIPSLADFLYACYEGIYYVMLDRLPANEKGALLETMGAVFEEYVGEVIRYYGLTTASSATLFPEQTYRVGKDEWKTADWLLVSDKYIVQIECKKRKIDNYARAGIQNTNGSGIERVLNDVANIADTLLTKEEHIKQGSVPGISYKGQSFVNTAVFLDEMFGFIKYARDQIKTRMRQQSDNFYLFGCYEFEMVCQQSKDKKQDVVESIRDVVAEKTEIYDIDFLHQEFTSFFDKLMDRERPTTPAST